MQEESKYPVDKRFFLMSGDVFIAKGWHEERCRILESESIRPSQRLLAMRAILQQEYARIAALPFQQTRAFALWVNRAEIHARHDLVPEINRYLQAPDGSIKYIAYPRGWLQLPVVSR